MRSYWISDDTILERIKNESQYIIDTQCTLRMAAKHTGVGKSTVHKDCTTRLKELAESNETKYADLYAKVTRIMKINSAEKHIRGGNATKQKYIRNGHKR